MVVNYALLCLLYWDCGCESWFFMLCQWLWIMVCYAEPVVVNHAVLYQAEWLWVMVCNAEPVFVNHGVLCWASGCESCVLYWIEQLWIMLCYTEPIVCHAELLVVNHMSQWLWIMECNTEPVVVNHGVLCWASGCGKPSTPILYDIRFNLWFHVDFIRYQERTFTFGWVNRVVFQ
jgi:hypothetical protein